MATILRFTKEKRNMEKLKFKVSNQGVSPGHSAVMSLVNSSY